MALLHLETRCENEGHTTHPCTLQQRESGGEGYTCCDFQGKRQRSGLGRRGLAASVIDDDERDLFVDQLLLGVMTHATVQRALNVAGTLFGEADERQEDEGDEAASAVSSISVAHQHPKDAGTSVGVNVDGVQSTLYICIALLILYILFPRVSDMRDNWKYR